MGKRLTQAEIYLGNPNLKRANVPINFTEEQIQEDLLEQLLRQQYRVIDIGRE